MSTAILYIRVSTDEQAKKGYSQRIQFEHLQKFCTSNQIEILKTIYEDHSAKTFKRPEWSQLIHDLTYQKSIRPDQILFTRWDRFSRNAADAYYMIEKLKKIRIQPCAIDQPLDLTIPENKIMLAIYLSTSEAENDRRSLNVKQGIHKAKQNGRCTSRPPLGYKNIILPDGTKSIISTEPDTTYVKNIFKTIAISHQSIQSIYRCFLAKGLKCSLNNFWLLIRNPFYCGNIIIPEYEQHERYLVKGLHKAIISEQLFSQVQGILMEKRKPKFTRILFNQSLPLRGLLKCPSCQKKLTGSRSKGKLKYYYYYHCTKGCKYRVRADFINTLFEHELEKLSPLDHFSDLFKLVFKETYQRKFGISNIDQENIFRSIDKISDRLTKAKMLMINGNIESEDYQLIRTDCEHKIHTLGIDLKDAANVISRANSITAIAMRNFCKLNFDCNDPLLKRKLIDLICEKQIIFNGSIFTSLFSQATKIIYGLDYSPILIGDKVIAQSTYTKTTKIASYPGDFLLDRNEPKNRITNLFLERIAEIILEVSIQ